MGRNGARAGNSYAKRAEIWGHREAVGKREEGVRLRVHLGLDGISLGRWIIPEVPLLPFDLCVGVSVFELKEAA